MERVRLVRLIRPRCGQHVPEEMVRWHHLRPKTAILPFNEGWAIEAVSRGGSQRFFYSCPIYLENYSRETIDGFDEIYKQKQL